MRTLKKLLWVWVQIVQLIALIAAIIGFALLIEGMVYTYLV